MRGADRGKFLGPRGVRLGKPIAFQVSNQLALEPDADKLLESERKADSLSAKRAVRTAAFIPK